jgi:hypothetical protein
MGGKGKRMGRNPSDSGAAKEEKTRENQAAFAAAVAATQAAKNEKLLERNALAAGVKVFDAVAKYQAESALRKKEERTVERANKVALRAAMKAAKTSSGAAEADEAS